LGLSGGELIIVLVAILILFGSKKIPEFAKGLGQGIKEFKKASSDVTNELHNAMEQEPPRTTPQTRPTDEKSLMPSNQELLRTPPPPPSAAPSSTVPKS
jgi:sec-independent protein translocase protein TatA